MVFKSMQAVEDYIPKSIVAKFVPQVLDWIEFRRIGWQ